MNAHVNISNTDMSGTPGPNAGATSASLAATVRPFYWSLRRELWENRSIYIAPVAVAAIVLLASLVNYFTHSGAAIPFQEIVKIPEQYLRFAGMALYGVTAVVMAVTAGIVGWFYCLDALSSERRERSVLFWKSLPVSDTTTVLSKVVVGMGVIPLVAFIVGLALYVTMSLLAIVIAAANGANGLPLFANSGFGEALVLHFYVAIVAILWSAPLYAWAIFVSSWVRRAAFLWALLPPAGVALAEGLAFGTNYFAEMVGKRVSGGIRYAFVDMGGDFDGKHFKFDSGNIPESLLTFTDPARFFSQPGLWIGLIVAAGFIAAAIWMRRYREPL